MTEESNIDYQVKVIDGKEYLRVIRSDELYEKKGRRIRIGDDDDSQVAIFRVDGKLYCLWNICPHRHTDQIYNGFIKEGTVICPVHGWTYYLATGKNVNSKQGLKGLMTFEIFEEDGYIYIEKPDIQVPKWRRQSLSGE
jgi:nitrite reductase/ring-hydroxylating ferredoxin subunit